MRTSATPVEVEQPALGLVQTGSVALWTPVGRVTLGGSEHVERRRGVGGSGVAPEIGPSPQLRLRRGGDLPALAQVSVDRSLCRRVRRGEPCPPLLGRLGSAAAAASARVSAGGAPPDEPHERASTRGEQRNPGQADRRLAAGRDREGFRLDARGRAHGGPVSRGAAPVPARLRAERSQQGVEGVHPSRSAQAAAGVYLATSEKC
jgi:hypothetical protein